MQNLMPPIGTPDNLFHDGNPLTGEQGTIVTAAHLNNVQGATRDLQTELLAVLADAKIEVNPADHAQLLKALKAVISTFGAGKFLSISNNLKEIADAGPEAIAAAHQYLQIGTAGKRNVGTGAGQIPDMSAWQFGGDFINGWKRAPDGTIEQWGMSAGVTTNDAQIRFHIPFTTGVYELNEHDSGQGSSQITTLWTFIDVTLTGAIARNIGSFTRGVPTLNAPSLSQCRWHAKGK